VDPLDRRVAGLTCRQVLHALGDYLDGDLTPTAMAQVQQHLAECDTCAQFGGRVANLIAALRTSMHDHAVPDDVARRVHDRLTAVRG
jgi:anti-sigma factor (TIGR02949 family)